MIDDCQARIRNAIGRNQGDERCLQYGPGAIGRAASGNHGDVAQEIPHSLVLMTTHGRSGLKRLMLGSVTDSVVRNAHGPVMVIPSAS